MPTNKPYDAPASGGTLQATGGITGEWIFIATAVAFLALMVPTLALHVTDARLLNGVGIWVKPLKFQLSIAIHMATIVVLLRVLPAPDRNRAAPAVMAVLFAALAAFEIVYIMLQCARGEASHFNTSTAFTRTMYALMGVAAVTLLVITGWIGVNIWRLGRRGDVLVLGASLGLVLGSLLGTMTGIHLGGRSGHWVGGLATDAGGLPLFGWSRTGGDLRFGHFVGLHQMQVIPAVAWLAAALLPRRAACNTVLVFAGLGAFATLATTLQALAGRPLLP